MILVSALLQSINPLYFFAGDEKKFSGTKIKDLIGGIFKIKIRIKKNFFLPYEFAG